eukprot:COSAG02_NODE_4505_length_5285_cov_2.317971_1_plen_195_part_00
MVGFSVGFAVSMPDSTEFGLIEHNATGGPFHGLLIVFQSALGGFDLDDYTHPIAVMLYPVLSFVMVLVMLNLLIAMMSDTYEEIKNDADKEVQKLKAETIISVQQRLCRCQRTKQYFPDYLQVLVPQPRTTAFTKRFETKEQVVRLQHDVQGLQQNMCKVLTKLDAISSDLRRAEGAQDRRIDAGEPAAINKAP